MNCIVRSRWTGILKVLTSTRGTALSEDLAGPVDIAYNRIDYLLEIK